MKKSLLALLFLILLGTRGFADSTVTLFYKDGNQEKIIVPDGISFDFIFIKYLGIAMKYLKISAHASNYEPLKEKDIQAVKKLSAQIGDGMTEKEEKYGTTTCSFKIEDKITGLKIE